MIANFSRIRAGQYCNLENRPSQIQLATGLINKFRPSEYSKKEKRKVFSNFGQGGQKIQIGRFSLYFANFFYYHARADRLIETHRIREKKNQRKVKDHLGLGLGAGVGESPKREEQ